MKRYILLVSQNPAQKPLFKGDFSSLKTAKVAGRISEDGDYFEIIDLKTKTSIFQGKVRSWDK